MKNIKIMTYILHIFCFIICAVQFVRTGQSSYFCATGWIFSATVYFYLYNKNMKLNDSIIDSRDSCIKQLFKCSRDDEKILRGMSNHIRHLNEQNEFLENIVFENNTKNVKFKKRWKI